MTDSSRKTEGKKYSPRSVAAGIFVVALLVWALTSDKDKTPDKPEATSVQTPVQEPQAASAAASAVAPVSPITGPITADELRAQVASLLAELDVFKNSSEFRQCVYGCQQGSMGKEWNRKREALQNRVTPQTDAPVLLKAAPAELHALGMAYAKGRDAEADEIRAGIEKALQQ